MAANVHRVVKDPHDLDGIAVDRAVDHEVTPAAALTDHVERSEPRRDLVARPTARDLRPVTQPTQGRGERSRVDAGLA